MLRNVLLKWTCLRMDPLLMYSPSAHQNPMFPLLLVNIALDMIFWGGISLHIGFFCLQLCLIWLCIHQDVDPLHWGFILSRRRSPDLSLPAQMRDPDFPSREVQGYRELHHASPLTDRTWNWEWGKMMSYCKNLKLTSLQLLPHKDGRCEFCGSIQLHGEPVIHAGTHPSIHLPSCICTHSIWIWSPASMTSKVSIVCVS